MNIDLMCCCCRNIECDHYTLYKGYLLCSYCFEDLKLVNPNEDIHITYWINKRYKALEEEKQNSEAK